MSVADFLARFVSHDLSRRDFSLDVLRGLMIVGMVFVNHPPPGAPVFAPFVHAAWHGWTLADTIFPGFLFVVGVSIRLAVVDVGGRPASADRAMLRKLASRFGFLFLLNFLLLNFPYYEWGNLHFTGTLALIGWCYVIAALIHLYCGWRAQVAAILLALGSQWALLGLLPVPGYGAGVLSPEGNAARYIDLLLFDWVGSRNGDQVNIVVLPTLGAVATTLIGVVAGHWLRSPRELNERLAGIFSLGLLLMMVGGAWQHILPINKQLWTGSYVLFTAGLAMQLLAAIAWTSEHCGYRALALPLRVAGVNALFFYVFAQSLQRMLVYGRIRTEEGPVRLRYMVYERFFEPFFTGKFGAFAYTIVFLTLCYSVTFLLYRRRMFLKL